MRPNGARRFLPSAQRTPFNCSSTGTTVAATVLAVRSITVSACDALGVLAAWFNGRHECAVRNRTLQATCLKDPLETRTLFYLTSSRSCGNSRHRGLAHATRTTPFVRFAHQPCSAPALSSLRSSARGAQVLRTCRTWLRRGPMCSAKPQWRGTRPKEVNGEQGPGQGGSSGQVE